MADKTPRDPAAPFATRIDPNKETLSPEQKHFIRQVELQQWKKKTQTLRTRNVVTGLAIGALVLGICILHSARVISIKSSTPWWFWVVLRATNTQQRVSSMISRIDCFLL
ncbi:cytochrome c oxidase assembly factor 3 homolog, mitochondrial isoform X1 [Nelusetta ayraudi]|uniref:cytochrome c oxidase assembly factor 3 homolog, mitochondrial isoform X1 n=1 Tax=Nelusetta ayraudi TaxID=303726 RepID=UPI003F714C39